jgi:ABC-type transporter Mla subunit MlaD
MNGYLTIIITRLKQILDQLRDGSGVDPAVLKSIADNLQRIADGIDHVNNGLDTLVQLNTQMAKDLDAIANATPPEPAVGIEVTPGAPTEHQP